jgi:hypothetical protein
MGPNAGGESAMTPNRLDSALSELEIPELLDKVRAASIVQSVSDSPTGGPHRNNPAQLARLAFLYEREAASKYDSFIHGQSSDYAAQFSLAYSCWLAIAKLLDSDACRRIFSSELAQDSISLDLNIAFRLSVAGVLAQRTPDTRFELRRFSLSDEIIGDVAWRAQVQNRVFAAFTLLVRKANGWTDIDNALRMIGDLRGLQAQSESRYLDAERDRGNEAPAAVELVGLYHLAQIVTLTGDYLRRETDSLTQTFVRLDRHKDRAIEAFDAAGRETPRHLTELLWIGCRQLVQNSIWTHISGLGERIREFATSIAGQNRPQPVIELWPSQQDALRRNLLDPYKRAVLVEMPTSAGKTLLAKFSIVQTQALNPNGVIVYVVPTRALVNQVTMDLRDSFRDLKLRVEQTVPAFELDPTEERLLASKPHILVTTPEKLDLLIRKNHTSTTELALVIADEAHNIREEGRGARLELLLGMIKRERPGARFLLMSPFLPNDKELVHWLGDDRAAEPILLHWRPGNKVVGVVTLGGKGQNKKLILRTVPAADNTDVPAGLEVSLGSGKDVAKTLKGITSAAARTIVAQGAVLILCEGPGTAMTRARQIADDLPVLPDSPTRDVVCRYLESEIGRPSGLTGLLKRGVAYHHSGLSQEARWLVESLIRKSEVQIVCGTTTLAQGVNFPIRAVLVETLKKGDTDLSYQDFWNIAGRAGRTLMDAVGVVGFPAMNKNKEGEFISFLKGEALEITSQLSALLARVEEIGDNFSLNTVYKWPQLSSLLQFLAHAAKVSGGDNVAAEVEDLLRSSLVYHQAQRQGRDTVGRLVRLCKAYVQQVRSEKSLLALADQTGFATPSVLQLLARKSGNKELATASNWTPQRLFGLDLQPLTARVAAIASLPEIRLGQGKGQPFNPERVAAILRDWVSGETLDTLSRRHLLNPEETDPDRRVMNFTKYLFSTLIGRASWGFGALETVCLAGIESKEWEAVGHIPSMIFFGVRRKEAVWLRMVGVPRIVANGLADVWTQSRSGEPESYDDLRGWVNSLTDDQWNRAIPAGAPLRPSDARQLWSEFTT